MVDALDGNILKNVQINNTKSNVSVNTFNADSVLEFGYCTEFIIMLDKVFSAKMEKDFKAFLESIGDSIVVVADEELVKVLQHTRYELIKGTLEEEITGIICNTEKIRGGELFVCLKGECIDGHCLLIEFRKRCREATV